VQGIEYNVSESEKVVNSAMKRQNEVKSSCQGEISLSIFVTLLLSFLFTPTSLLKQLFKVLHGC
jgi:hypothetical protein